MQDVSSYLQELLWNSGFDSDILMTASRCKARISDIECDKMPDGGLVLIGDWVEKTGSRYKPEVTLWYDGNNWQIDTECNCDARFGCMHSATMLHRASQPHITEKLLNFGSLKNAGSVYEKPETNQRAIEPVRLRSSPQFKLEFKRLPSCPEVVAVYLKKKSKAFANISEGSYPLAWVTVSYHSEEFGTFTFPLLSEIHEGETQVTLNNGQLLIIERFRAIEKDAVSLLSRCGLTSVASDFNWLARIKSKKAHWLEETYASYFPDPYRGGSEMCWLDMRSAGVALLEKYGWDISVEEGFGYKATLCQPDDWEFDLSEGKGGWFSLSVGFDYKGKKLDLLPILAHLLKDNFMQESLDRPNNGTQFAVLPDGSSLELPVGRVRDILHHLAKFIDPKFPSNCKIHAVDVVQLADESDLGLDTIPNIDLYRQKLKAFDQHAEVSQPKGLQASLRDYQLLGLKWMQNLVELNLNGILADDMGLGKTLQSLAHILLEMENGRAASADAPALVIAPTSVVTNWAKEAQKFAPHLKCLILQGGSRHRYYPSIPHSDIVLTSYALLHRDIEKLKAYRFHLVFLDEAQYIKNPDAKATQAAYDIRANHRLCLSGTPVENNLGEFWSLMRFLMPGLLGRKDTFNSFYRVPIENQGDEEKRAALKSRVEALILRRTKDEVAKELPPKTELIHQIELTSTQKDLYEAIRATMDKKIRQAISVRGIDASQMFFLSALLKLRQICCHPSLLEDQKLNQPSAKLDFTLELIETLLLEGRKILLFSQFTTMLDLIGAELEKRQHKYLQLTGATKDRSSLVDQFQNGEAPIFLISLKAGGTGLTLTEADTVIHYDPWWNPAVERQATDRAYRIGQTKPVFVHKLICEDTVEEKIFTLQRKKGDLADALLSDSASLKLTPETLQSLLSTSAE